MHPETGNEKAELKLRRWGEGAGDEVLGLSVDWKEALLRIQTKPIICVLNKRLRVLHFRVPNPFLAASVIITTDAGNLN